MGLNAMLVRPREVALVLTLIVTFIAAKHIPIFEFLPLAQMTGVVCFAFAIYLSLRIYRAELARIRSE